MTPARVGCPSCAESVAAEARVCPHCRQGTLVTVGLSSAVRDGRVRYAAARAAAALGPPVLGFVELQQAMTSAAPVLTRQATRAEADRLVAVLEANGIADATIAAAAPSAGERRWLLPALGAAAAVLVVAAWLGTRGGGAPQAAARPARSTAEPASAPAAAVPAAPVTASARALAQAALPSTVSLRCAGSVASGFFVGPETVLTNAHVLCPAGENLRVVLHDGRESVGVLLRADEALDLALVRVPGSDAPALPLGDAAALQVGDAVMLIGSPVGMEFSVGTGTVSNVDRVLLGVAYVQIDAKVNPGNSGGALLDSAGRVVGVVSMKRTDAEGIGLVLPINYAYGTAELVPAPAGSSPAGFEAMLARAQKSDSETAAAVAAAAPAGPGLLAARVDGPRHLAVLVGRMSSHPPRYEDVRFRLWSGETRLCTIATQVLTWKEHGGGAAGQQSAFGSRVDAWARKNGLDRSLFVGEASVSLAECPSLEAGMELELEGADGHADRVRLN